MGESSKLEEVIVEEQVKDIKLPFEIPDYPTYPLFTAMQGILKGYGTEKNWIYNNYILLWADKEAQSEYYWVDFKFADESDVNNFCPLIVKKNRGFYDNNVDFIRTVKEYIDNKCYFFVSVDMFYVDEWWRDEKSKFHQVHQLLVFGYSVENEFFYTADFYGGRYNQVCISFDTMMTAYNGNNKGTDDYEKKYSTDVLLKYHNQNKVYDIDLSRITSLIKDFLESRGETDVNYINICKKDTVCYGLDFIKMVKDNVIYNDFSAQQYDLKPMQFLLQMNKIMFDRMNMLEKIGIVSLDDRAHQLLEKCLTQSETIRNIIIKHNIMKKKVDAEVFADLMDKMIIYEEEMLKYCYYIISGKQYVRDEYKENNVIHTQEFIRCTENKLAKYILEDEAYISKIADKVKTMFRVGDAHNGDEKVDVNVFPFDDIIIDYSDIRRRLDNNKDGEIIEYSFDTDNRIIMKKFYKEIGLNGKTQTTITYEYDNNIIRRCTYCFNACAKKNKLHFQDIFVMKNDMFTYFYRNSYVSNDIWGKFKYHDSKLCQGKFFEIDSENKMKDYYDFYYYNNDKIGYVLRERNNKRYMIFPRFGNTDLDYGKIKDEIVEDTKDLLCKRDGTISSIRYKIESDNAAIQIIIEWSDKKQDKLVKYFMKDYERGEDYKEYLTIFLLQVANQLLGEGIFIKKKKSELWRIEVYCDNRFIRKYENDKEMNYFLKQ